MSYNGPDITVTADRAANRSLEGRRVRLIFVNDPYTLIKPMMKGTVDFVDDAGTIHCTWENGSRLGLIPGIDRWEWINE